VGVVGREGGDGGRGVGGVLLIADADVDGHVVGAVVGGGGVCAQGRVDGVVVVAVRVSLPAETRYLGLAI